MFVRKKKNRSGSTSVVVVDKSGGRFRELTTIGVSSDEKQLATLYRQGKKWIDNYCGNRDMFVIAEQLREEMHVTEHLLNNIENILLNGTQLILNEVFKLIGFDAIDDGILKQLVIARLCQPASKAGTVDYLKSHFDEDVELHKIYRYLDHLHKNLQEKVQQISVEHTRKILGGNIGLVFYDVTTLYFESDDSDDLREKGFSKDGKHSQPQVVLGLLVSRDVCICFIAYKVYKELERILKTTTINISVDKVLDIAKTITTLKIKLPISGETLTKTMLLTHKHKSIKQLFDENFWEKF